MDMYHIPGLDTKPEEPLGPEEERFDIEAEYAYREAYTEVEEQKKEAHAKEEFELDEGMPSSDSHHLDMLDSTSLKEDYIEGVFDNTSSADGKAVSAADKSSPELERLTSLVQKYIGTPETKPLSGDEVRIGNVTLTIPPTNIQISESRNTQSITGLRTNTEALIRSGRGAIEITMTLKFADVDTINSELRPIIAQFRTAPFITITSEYLSNAIHKRLVDSIQSEKLEALSNREALLIKQITDIRTRINDQINNILGGQSKSDAIKECLKKLNENTSADNIEKQAGKLKGLINSLFSGVEQLSPLSGTDRMKALTELADYLAVLPGIATEIRQVKYSAAGIRNLQGSHHLPIVPIAQSSLEFGPDTNDQGEVIPGAAKAMFKVFYFNYYPFSLGFEFKDYKGDPTYDMGQCPFYSNYVTRRFLKPGFGLGLRQPSFTSQSERPLSSFEEEYEGMLGFRFPTTILERVPTDDRTDRYINPVREVVTTKNMSLFPSRFTVPLVELGTGNFINMHEDLVFTKDDPNFIVAAISVKLENKLAMQPIQGSLYPTFQYMGGVNARVSLIANVVGSLDDPQYTHDQVLRKLRYLKAESEAVALSGMRMRRHHKIFIANNWANVAGVQAVQLLNTAVGTSPNGPAQSQVRMEFVEFRVSQESREMLLNNRPNMSEEVRMALRFATDYYRDGLYEEYQRQARKYRYTAGVDVDNIVGERSKTLSRVVGWHLYGGGVPVDFGKGLGDKTPEDLERLYKQGRLGRHEVREHKTMQVHPQSMGSITHAIAFDYPQGYVIISEERIDVDPDDHNRYKLFVKYIGYVYYWKDVSRAQDSTDVPGIINQDTTNAALLRTPDHGERFADKVMYGVTVGKLTANAELRAEFLLGEWKGRAIRVKDLKEYFLDRWALKKGEKPRFDPGGLCQRVPDDFIDELVSLIMAQEIAHDPVLSAAKERGKPYVPYRVNPDTNLRERVLKLSNWMAKNIPEYKILMAQLRTQARDRSTYPDLGLPTFEEAFEPVFKALDENYDKKSNLNDYTETVKTFLRKFVPTYQDLGIIPPYSRTRLDFVRTRKDLVDPDFYWHYIRMQDKAEELFQEHKKELKDPGNSAPAFGGTGMQKEIGSDSDKTETYIRRHRGRQPLPIDSVGKPTDLARVPGNGNKDYKSAKFDYMPVLALEQEKRSQKRQDVQNVMESFDLLSPKYNIALARKIMESQPDDRWRMSKCFPTFQLYFLEQDAEQWGYLDDTFSYLAVNEIRTRKEKFMPAVADITLINISGNLDESMAASVAAKRYKFGGTSWIDEVIGPAAGIISGDDSWANDFTDSFKQSAEQYSKGKSAPKGDKEPFTGEDKYLDHFFLGPGSMIAIRKGYSSKPEELETVFTGQIVEIERGDVIHIIAQDYSTELTVPVDGHLTSSGFRSYLDWLPFVAKKNYGDAVGVIDYVMKKSPTDHYGVYDWGSMAASIMGRETDRFGGMPDTYGRLRYSQEEGTDTHQEVWKSLTGLYDAINDHAKGKTRKRENIFYTGQPWLIKKLTGAQWVIPHKTGLEVLHELTRHNPGWVSATRTYDLNGATLYFGKTAGYYYNTAWGREGERKWYRGGGHKSLHKEIETGVKNLLTGYGSSKFAQMWGRVRNYEYQRKHTYVSSGESLIWAVDNQLRGYVKDDGGSSPAIEHVNKVWGDVGAAGMKALVRSFFNKDFEPNSLGRYTSESLLAAYGDYDSPGTMLVSQNDWMEKVDTLSANMEAGSDAVRLLKFEALVANPNYSATEWLATETDKITDVMGNPVGRSAWRDAVNFIVGKQREWKAFIHTFALYLSDKSTDIVAARTAALVSLKNEPHLFPPRTRPFRRYHSADSSSNLINNGIRASRDQISNYVIVNYPEKTEVVKTQKKSHMFVDGKAQEVIQFAQDIKFEKWIVPYCELTKDERIVRTVTEMNADGIVKAELCGYSNLAEAMRPMYRGELTLRGNEKIDPWDIITIYDAYNDMHGHIEVEAVTHHFTYDTGFVSSVSPHALVIPNSHSDHQHCIVQGVIRAAVGLAGQVGVGGAGLLLLGHGVAATGMGIGLLIAAWKGIPALTKNLTGATIWGNVVGKGRYGNRNYPIHMLPLVVSGLPYVVGLQKLGPRGFSVRWGQKWRKFTRGIVGASWNMANRIRTGMVDEGTKP